MSARRPYFEIVRRDDGWLARFRGANGHIVFSSELYVRRESAQHAIDLLTSSAAGEAANPGRIRYEDER